MGRVLKILLYLVLLFVLYIWLSTVFKSCNSGDSLSGTLTETVDATGDAIGDITDAGDELLDEVDDFYDDEDDDVVDDEEYIDEEEVDYEALDAEEDYQDEDIYEEEDYAAPAQAEKPKTVTPKPSRSTSTGNYFVITGSYLVESNARVMRDKLAKMGYNSEVVIFDGSQYHAAIAGRFASHEDAREVSRKLTGKGIDNFIQKQKL